MDSTDYRILNLIQDNCRATLKEVGQQVGLTPPAVAERIHKMEDKGIITGFRACVNRVKLDCGLTAFIFVATRPERHNDFCAFCRKSPIVTAHYHTIGVYNALLHIAAKNTGELEDFLAEVKKYGDSRTSIELEALFETKDIPY